MISVCDFGEIYGRAVKKYRLQKGDICAEVSDFGATLLSLIVPDREGTATNVVLGYNSPEEYSRYDGYLGASIGRVANRVGGASFSFEGKEYKLFANDGNNSLHGGKVGFDKKIWNATVLSDSVIMTCESEEGEEGYFGNLHTEAEFFIDDDFGFNIVYTAATDSESAVNLTNHVYFNLNGEGSGNVLSHAVCIKSSCITPIDENLVPNGTFMDVKGTPFDFTVLKRMGEDVEKNCSQLKFAGGYDHNFVLDLKEINGHCATVKGDKSGIIMETYTNQNGLQFYGGNFLTLRMGRGGRLYDKRDGFCLEAQSFPNALNLPSFGQPIIRNGEIYTNSIRFRFPSINK